MWDQVLKRIDANKTPLLAAQRWEKPIDKIHRVNEGVNLVYYFENQNQRYYLRITHRDLRPETQLLAAILYQDHLFQHGVAICEPVRSCNNEWIEIIRQGEDCFLAHVCKEVPGKPIDFGYPSDALYKRWGRTLGQLHQSALHYSIGDFEYATWSKSLDEMYDYIEREDKSAQATLDQVAHFMKTRSKSNTNFGLTHGDHREGNVITNGKDVHIIDFDLPCQNWFTEDVFRPFFDSVVNDDFRYKNKIIPYLEGYFEIMPENSLDLGAFSKQIQMKCLEIYLWTKNNWSDDSAAPGGNEKKKWLENIYRKIVQNDWIEALPVL